MMMATDGTPNNSSTTRSRPPKPLGGVTYTARRASPQGNTHHPPMPPMLAWLGQLLLIHVVKPLLARRLNE